jgi:hypothetical protein
MVNALAALSGGFVSVSVLLVPEIESRQGKREVAF